MSTMQPIWIRSAQSKWQNIRSVWAAEIYKLSHEHSMTNRPEFHAFSSIQKWIALTATNMMPELRTELLQCAAADQKDDVCREAAMLEQRLDWSAPAAALLYGSCAQGVSERGGDADFSIVFRRRQLDVEEEDSNKSSVSLFEEPIRFLQRSIVLPVFFRHAGSKFPSAIDGLTSGPQQLHVDRILHARVPVLRMVSAQTILPSWAPVPTEQHQQQTGGSKRGVDLPLPSFDISACSSGCLNSALLRTYFEQWPPLRVIVLALKRWSRTRKLVHARKGWLSPYSLTIMVVFWAQQRGHVTSPSLPAAAAAAKAASRSSPTSWSLDSSSPLFDAERCFLPHQDLDIDMAVERDSSLELQASIGALILDFFVFYAHEFDRDVHVVDIRTGDDKVRTRSEWKEQVMTKMANQELDIFGIEKVRRESTLGAAMATAPGTRGSVFFSSSAPSSSDASSSLSDHGERLEQVIRHLFGHDVMSVRDPVEPHSVCRSLDFFRAEAVFDEMRNAIECESPMDFLGIQF